MGINERVNSDKLSAEQEKLLSEQMRETEQLEERQRAAERDMNRHLDDEMAAEEMALETQIQQQKRLVSYYSYFYDFTH